MMNKVFALVCGYVFSVGVIYGQTGVIQDDDGKSSLALRFNSDTVFLATINASDKSLALTYVPEDVRFNTRLYFSGVQFKMSGKDNKFPTLKDGIANFQVDLNTTLTYLIGGGTFNYIYLQPKFGVGRVFLVSQQASTVVTSRTETSILTSAQFGFNSLSLRWLHENAFIGFAGDFGFFDNAKRIDKIEYRTVKNTGVDDKGNPVFVTTEIKDGYQASEFKEGRFFSNFLVDLGYRGKRILPMIHLRWETFEGDGKGPFFSPGVGLYLTENRKPSKAVLGIHAFVKDYFDERGKGSVRSERVNINAVVGFKF